MTRDELVAHLRELDSPRVGLGVGFLREEIFRRDCEAQNQELGRMTKQIRTMTGVVAFLTFIVTAATVALLFRPG